VKQVSDYFHHHLTDYVHWPHTVTEKNNKAMPFYQETKKPKCFGMVDGTHIAISCPQGIDQDENQYYCYKGYYSINTMVSTVSLHYNILFTLYISPPKN